MGLLEECSLYELQEKLEQIKEQKKLEEEQTRKKIIQTKNDDKKKMSEMVDMITQARKERETGNACKREEKKQKLDNRHKKEDERNRRQTKEVHELIMQKKEDYRKEDEIIQKKAREIKLKKQYLKANQAKVEEQAWKNQEDGAEREIKERQNGVLMAQEKLLSIKLKERQI